VLRHCYCYTENRIKAPWQKRLGLNDFPLVLLSSWCRKQCATRIGVITLLAKILTINMQENELLSLHTNFLLVEVSLDKALSTVWVLIFQLILAESWFLLLFFLVELRFELIVLDLPYPRSSNLCLPLSWDDRWVPPCPDFYWLKWGFGPGCPQSVVLQISASWVAWTIFFLKQ
jgi:hypothetical protein